MLIDDSDKKLTSLLYILIPSICIPLVILCLFLTYCYCRRSNSNNNKTGNGSANGGMGGSSVGGGSSNLTAHTKLRMSNGSVAMKSKTLQTKYSHSGKTSSSKSSVASSLNAHNNNNMELNPFIQQQQQQQQLHIQQQQQQQPPIQFFHQQLQQQQQHYQYALTMQHQQIDSNQVKQYSPNNIRFLQEVGKGRFGTVFIGELVGSVSQTSVIKCILKTLNDGEPKIMNGSTEEQDFYNEINLYSTLKHRNLSNLIGICTSQATNSDVFSYGNSVTDIEENDESEYGRHHYHRNYQPKCMIMEYLTSGDLHEYLLQRACANQSTLSMSSGSTIGINSNISRNIHDFLYIGQQIAMGMEYLIKQNFVHKDLATRNILMGDNLLIKISDLGQYKEKYAKDYYKFQNKLLPVRWMSPESLLFGRYAQDTDIWSFGILLWEIFNYGCTPYSGCTNPEVIQMIRDRQLLMIPDECPQRVYQLMLECWHENSVQRPTFTDLVSRLKNWENYYTVSIQQSNGNRNQVHNNCDYIVNTNCNNNLVNTYSSNSQNSKASSNGGAASGNTNNTGSTAISSTSTPTNQLPPSLTLPPPPAIWSANTVNSTPLPLPPTSLLNCYSPNKNSTTFGINKRPASPPSSNASTRIYREIETNTLRNSQRPLLYTTATTATTSTCSSVSNNNQNTNGQLPTTNLNLIPTL